MTPHDPVKAAFEELSGMQDTFKVLGGLLRDAERRAGEAEVQLNSLLKVRAVFAEVIAIRQAEIAAMRAAQEADTK